MAGEGKEGLIVITRVEGHGRIPICRKKLRYAAFLALRVFRSCSVMRHIFTSFALQGDRLLCTLTISTMFIVKLLFSYASVELFLCRTKLRQNLCGAER